MDIKSNQSKGNQDMLSSAAAPGASYINSISSARSEPAASGAKSKKRGLGGFRLKRKLILVGVAVVVVGAIGFAGYSYYSLEQLKKNPQALAQKEVSDITGKLSRIIYLPSDEQPTIATVKDKEKLKDQPFFKDAQNGDKLLVYTKARQAIIYREKENKIVNVGPVTGTDTVSQR